MPFRSSFLQESSPVTKTLRLLRLARAARDTIVGLVVLSCSTVSRYYVSYATTFRPLLIAPCTSDAGGLQDWGRQDWRRAGDGGYPFNSLFSNFRQSGCPQSSISPNTRAKGHRPGASTRHSDTLNIRPKYCVRHRSSEGLFTLFPCFFIVSLRPAAYRIPETSMRLAIAERVDCNILERRGFRRNWRQACG